MRLIQAEVASAVKVVELVAEDAVVAVERVQQLQQQL